MVGGGLDGQSLRHLQPDDDADCPDVDEPYASAQHTRAGRLQPSPLALADEKTDLGPTIESVDEI